MGNLFSNLLIEYKELSLYNGDAIIQTASYIVPPLGTRPTISFLSLIHSSFFFLLRISNYVFVYGRTPFPSVKKKEKF